MTNNEQEDYVYVLASLNEECIKSNVPTPFPMIVEYGRNLQFVTIEESAGNEDHMEGDKELQTRNDRWNQVNHKKRKQNIFSKNPFDFEENPNHRGICKIIRSISKSQILEKGILDA